MEDFLDLFEDEQKAYDSALKYIKEIQNDSSCDAEKYKELAKEYGKILKQLRRTTHLADRTATDLTKKDISKSAFLANMSHEIRTPMNSIIGFSELALDNEDEENISPKIKDYLEKIKTNAQWLLNIINDILDISKIESGKLELEMIPFDMQKLLSDCKTLMMHKAIEKNLELHFYTENLSDMQPLGDPTRLRQVFVNLLSNALKFTKTGNVKLTAVLTEKSESTVTIHFEVKDTGIGITPEQIKKIFEPFTQAETGTTRKYGGTGLGLPICKNIIEMMGGTLFVESTPGSGSTFSFDLTFNITAVSAGTDEHIAEGEIEKPEFEGEVLIFEDNIMNQMVICENLERLGLKTVVADNGEIGVEIVKSRMEKGEKLFDLILMDMYMPVMDGLTAASKLQEMKAGIPMAAMTANVMTEDRELYRQHGMNDCIGKPFRHQELWACLLKYLKPVTIESSKL